MVQPLSHPCPRQRPAGLGFGRFEFHANVAHTREDVEACHICIYHIEAFKVCIQKSNMRVCLLATQAHTAGLNPRTWRLFRPAVLNKCRYARYTHARARAYAHTRTHTHTHTGSHEAALC